MLYYALIFLVIALIAGILGFTGIAGAAVGIGKILFFIFLALCILSFVFGSRSRSWVTSADAVTNDLMNATTCTPL